MSFADALAQVLAREGGWYPGDRPSDPNPTMQGIIQRTYDAYRDERRLPHRSVQQIEEGEVAAIYRMKYWIPIRGEDLPPQTAIAVFDMAVNSGPVQAIKTLQTTIGATPDGLMGPSTIAHVAAFNDAALVQDFLWQRVAFYARLCRAKPIKLPELPGWLRRLELLREAVR